MFYLCASFDIHTHSNLSDGRATPRQKYIRGQRVRNLLSIFDSSRRNFERQQHIWKLKQLRGAPMMVPCSLKIWYIVLFPVSEKMGRLSLSLPLKTDREKLFNPHLAHSNVSVFNCAFWRAAVKGTHADNAHRKRIFAINDDCSYFIVEKYF